MAEDSKYQQKLASLQSGLAEKEATYSTMRGRKHKRGRGRMRTAMAADRAAIEDLQNKYSVYEEATAGGQDSVSARIAQRTGGVLTDMDVDTIKGAQFGEAVLGPDGLGRQEFSDDFLAMEAQAKELAKGFSSEEMLARRERAKEGIAGNTEAQARAAQAQLARSGVKGMQAGMQLGTIRQAGIEATADMERDLMIQNRQAQMEGLGLQTNLFDRRSGIEQFNLSQAAKEKDIALQAGLGFAQMGEARRSAKLAADTQVRAARAGKQKSCFIAGTKVEMRDGTHKNIEDIELGDELKGGTVYSLHTGLTDTIYNYNGVFVSGMHAVNEKGVWKRVHKTGAEKLEDGVFTVYNLGTTDHRIYINGVEFADFDETDYGSQISDAASLEELNYGTIQGLRKVGGRL